MSISVVPESLMTSVGAGSIEQVRGNGASFELEG